MPFCGFTFMTLMPGRMQCQLCEIVIPDTGHSEDRKSCLRNRGIPANGEGRPAARRGPDRHSGPDCRGPAGEGHHHGVDRENEPEDRRERGRKAVFRVPGTALLAVVLLMVCLVPTAFSGVPGLWALYVVPLALIVFVVRTRTVASGEGLAVRTMFGHRELPWERLKGLAITGRAKVKAVLTDDTEVPLPTVRTRHLPVISLVSEGRLKDPSGLTDDEDQSPA